MKDLFDKEQTVLNQAEAYAERINGGVPCSPEAYTELVEEYGHLLKLTRRMTRVSDQTTVELNDAKIMLMDKVQYDALTQIYNRQYFDVGLKHAIVSCINSGEPLGILMMDVDFFKSYNDTYGHSAGDQCLRKISKKLTESIAEDSGFVARYGGEEFVAVLPNATQTQIQEIAESILYNIRALQIPHENNGGRGYVTISVGGASIDKVEEIHKEDYVGCADKALYKSKQSGRDCYTLYVYK